jgi:hypothetical protein
MLRNVINYGTFGHSLKPLKFCGKLEYLSKGTKIESKACCCGNSINLSIKVTGAK